MNIPEKKILYPIPWLLILAVITACGPIPDQYALLPDDLNPPVFISARTASRETLVLRFNEGVHLFQDTLTVTPELTLSHLEKEENRVVITFLGEQLPGKEYIISSVVRDDTGNTTSFTSPFYGYNPDRANLLINEFTTQGSASHPDVIELIALTGGNIAGISVYEGTPGNWDNRIILPELWVDEGDFLLIHCKPEGIPEEINETTNTLESGGLDASDSAYDFWVPGGSGLSGNNGVLTVSEYPGGPVMDGVLYSNRTSASDENYRGFGSAKTMDRADELYAAGEWTAAGDLIAPEDAVNPEDSTATRSICRGTDRGDTNSAADWHIVPTSGYTFGGENSDEVYEP